MRMGGRHYTLDICEHTNASSTNATSPQGTRPQAVLADRAAAAGLEVEEVALQQSEGYSTYVISLSRAPPRALGRAGAAALFLPLLLAAAALAPQGA